MAGEQPKYAQTSLSLSESGPQAFLLAGKGTLAILLFWILLGTSAGVTVFFGLPGYLWAFILIIALLWLFKKK